MIIKEVKNYSGRLRINITAKDGFQPNEDIVLMSTAEYDNIKETILDLQQQITILKNENDMLTEMESQLRQSYYAMKKKMISEDQLEDIIKLAVNPINEHYNSELQKKDDIINSKDNELNNIKAVLNKFTTSISGLSLWDLIRGRHKDLINDFHDSIWVNVPMDQVEDVQALPKNED